MPLQQPCQIAPGLGQSQMVMSSPSRHLLIGESDLAISILQVDDLTSYKERYMETMDDVDAMIRLWIEADVEVLDRKI